jgi:glyoxylase-like metal-dependent hydrolase (beta-lactamase superfamily II)
VSAPAPTQRRRRIRVERVVTSGTFSLDGGTWDVENNVWLVGDEDEVLIIDAAHSAKPILAAVGHRKVVAIACTHAHDDHVNVAPMLSALTGAPILLHSDDDVLWQMTHPGRPHGELRDGQNVEVGGTALRVIHTPGHSPGAVCFYSSSLEMLFSGDTLFRGGPGATGRSYSSFDTIIESIKTKLLVLPGRTVVHTGHGEDTSIGAEALSLQEWIRRGH